MAKALAHEASEAFVEDDFDRALDLYSQVQALGSSDLHDLDLNSTFKFLTWLCRLLRPLSRLRQQSYMLVRRVVLQPFLACERHSLGLTLLLCAARAQTHLKLENFLEASGDAQKAIEIDPKLGKAYLRRGKG